MAHTSPRFNTWYYFFFKGRVGGRERPFKWAKTGWESVTVVYGNKKCKTHFTV